MTPPHQSLPTTGPPSSTETSAETVEISVVIPTRDRSRELARCLAALLTQVTRRRFELIVVDDNRMQALAAPRDERVRVVVGPKRGPGAARNAGIDAAAGELILFTDDDTVPASGWLEAAARAMEADPTAVAVDGPTVATFDPLYEHAVMNQQPGALFTCNVGYRRSALLAEGGFDLAFPYPHCEDRDLGIRMARRGALAFSPEMLVEHPPRPIRAIEIMRRGHLVESEWVLFKKHPETTPPRWSPRWGPVVRCARFWQRLIVQEHATRGDLRRTARAVGLAAGQVTTAFVVTVTRWRRFEAHHGSQTREARG